MPFDGSPRGNKSELIIICTAPLTPLSSACSLQGPCHVELQRALEKIAKSQQKLGDKLTRFYLPNCDKHGLYKPKQVGVCGDFKMIVLSARAQCFNRGVCVCVCSASPPWMGRGVDAGV